MGKKSEVENLWATTLTPEQRDEALEIFGGITKQDGQYFKDGEPFRVSLGLGCSLGRAIYYCIDIQSADAYEDAEKAIMSAVQKAIGVSLTITVNYNKPCSSEPKSDTKKLTKAESL